MKKPLIAFVLLSLAVSFAHISSLDGIHGIFWATILNGNTIYSKEYSDKSFKQIKVGDSKFQVLEKIGSPIDAKSIYKMNSENWSYSKSIKNSNYHLRKIQFNLKGIVTKKISKFYRN